jgi:hypothetical protein
VSLTARVLASKLITRKPDDLKIIRVRRFQVLVKFLEPGKLRCEAAFRGRVDDEDDFVGEVGERVGVAFLCAAKY